MLKEIISLANLFFKLSKISLGAHVDERKSLRGKELTYTDDVQVTNNLNDIKNIINEMNQHQDFVNSSQVRVGSGVYNAIAYLADLGSGMHCVVCKYTRSKQFSELQAVTTLTEEQVEEDKEKGKIFIPFTSLQSRFEAFKLAKSSKAEQSSIPSTAPNIVSNQPTVPQTASANSGVDEEIYQKIKEIFLMGIDHMLTSPTLLDLFADKLKGLKINVSYPEEEKINKKIKAVILNLKNKNLLNTPNYDTWHTCFFYGKRFAIDEVRGQVNKAIAEEKKFEKDFQKEEELKEKKSIIDELKTAFRIAYEEININLQAATAANNVSKIKKLSGDLLQLSAVNLYVLGIPLETWSSLTPNGSEGPLFGNKPFPSSEMKEGEIDDKAAKFRQVTNFYQIKRRGLLKFIYNNPLISQKTKDFIQSDGFTELKKIK
jgi:hypothetical protein